MRGIIEISGDFANTVVTYHVSPEYLDSEGRVDVSKLKDGECLVYVTDAYRIQHSKIVRGYKPSPFILVRVDSPWSDWDIKKVKCNVPIEVTYNFSLNWTVYIFALESY